MDRFTTYTKHGVRALLAAMLLVFALCAAGMVKPADAYAANNGSITMNYTGEDTNESISSMAVYLFQVASVDGSNYVFTPAFSGYSEILDWPNQRHAISDDAAWLQKQANTLDGYVRSSAPDPTAFGTTDAAGSVSFTDLEPGLYLVLEAGDGVHKFSPTLIGVNDAVGLDVVAKPKTSRPLSITTSIKVVKLWKGDTGDTATRPASIKVQLIDGSEKVGDVVELNDGNGWNYTWAGLDASTVHQWDVIEVDSPTGYNVNIAVNDDGDVFTITNTYKPQELLISKQAVGGGAELPGAKLIIKDADGNIVDEWISGTEPHKVTLKPGIYTLTEVTAPDGYEIAETITFRVNEDGTTDVMVDGKWVDAKNHIVMFDAPTTPPTTPPTTTTTTTPNTPTKTITGKLPQTGQLWWPVPVLFCAGLVAIGAGRIVSHRSRAK